MTGVCLVDRSRLAEHTETHETTVTVSKEAVAATTTTEAATTTEAVAATQASNRHRYRGTSEQRLCPAGEWQRCRLRTR